MSEQHAQGADAVVDLNNELKHKNLCPWAQVSLLTLRKAT